MKNLMPGAVTSAVIGLLLLVAAPITVYSAKPMPPSFAFENEHTDILSSYPLGIINEQDAFAHHGGPIRKEVLPNGNQGWIYVSGEKAGVPSIYILQFSQDGFVIDVLHKDYRYKIGHSALQYQYLIDKDPMTRVLGPKPGH
jgi:hypothetical protein